MLPKIGKKGKQKLQGNFLTFLAKNKKGIMVKFLVTIILAIIIFVPACYLGAKIFRTSDQAKVNYIEFVEELDLFAKTAEEGQRGSSVMIMDEETTIVYFEKGARKVIVEADVELPYDDYVIEIIKPSQCEVVENCLCLFRKSEFVFDMSAKGLLTHRVDVKPTRVICSNLPYKLEIDSCSWGKAVDINSYTCSNGFFLERKLVEDVSINVQGYYENPRRRLVHLVKLGDAVRLTQGDRPTS